MISSWKRKPSGIAIIAIVMMMLLILSSMGFHAVRALVNNIKATVTDSATVRASQLADEALDWATGMANSPYPVSVLCNPGATPVASGKTLLRKKYIQTGADADVVPDQQTSIGCYEGEDGTRSCSCPDSTGSTQAPNPVLPAYNSFVVSFAPVTGETRTVRLTARACVGALSMCSDSTATDGDATAIASVDLKLLPVVKTTPGGALTCGSNCSLGSMTLSNHSTGIGALAGGTVTIGSATINGPPGTPADNLVFGGDSVLSGYYSNDSSCANASLFTSYFSSTMARYAASPLVKTLNCTGALDCSTKLNVAYGNGWRYFYSPTAVALTTLASGGTSIGSAADPLVLVANGAITFGGSMTIYGLVYANAAVTQSTAATGGGVDGAYVTCGSYAHTGGAISFSYDPAVLASIRDMGASAMGGTFAQVPGSWRDN